METFLVVGLIAGAAAIFTSLLVVGVQIIFYTKSFEEEYGEKVEKIKFKLKNNVDRFILDMIREKLRKIQSSVPKDDKKENKSVFSNLLDEIPFELIEMPELDELIEMTAKHNLWSQFTVLGKKNIRRIGILIIGIGITVLFFSGIAIFFEDVSVLAFMFIILFFLGVSLFSCCSDYHQQLKSIDDTYEKYQAGLEI